MDESRDTTIKSGRSANDNIEESLDRHFLLNSAVVTERSFWNYFYPFFQETTTEIPKPSKKQLLIFSPDARAETGENGTAVAIPLSRAIVKKGTDFKIIFEPKAVAVAGPGGTAHAESDLIIDYYE